MTTIERTCACNSELCTNRNGHGARLVRCDADPAVTVGIEMNRETVEFDMCVKCAEFHNMRRFPR